MEKQTRRRLFLFCLAVFLLLSFGLVFYSFGYSLDLAAWQVVKTGSLSLRANTVADVYLNGRLVGNTAFLSNTFSAGRLLPRTYTIRLQKESYTSWQKTVATSAGFVMDFPHVVLLSTKLTAEPVASGSFTLPIPENNKSTADIIKYIDSPDGSTAMWFDDHALSIKWLRDSDSQPFQKTGDTLLVTRYSQTISAVQWYQDSAHLIVSVGGILKFLETDLRGGLNSYDLFAPAGLSPISGQFFYDKEDNAIYEYEGKNLVRIKF